MLDPGFKISDLSNIPVIKNKCDKLPKIAFDNTFLLSYSHSVYGISYKRENYKIPLSSMRDDIRGYIGIESLKEPWTEQLKIWHGSWSDTDANKSYVYNGAKKYIANGICIADKFADPENSFYLITDAPFPGESGDKNAGEIGYLNECSINKEMADPDPYPDSHKLVTKKYIDERLASKRIIEVGPAFTIRDYDCNYIIRHEEFEEFEKLNKAGEIKITLPSNFESRILHNKLQFTVLIEGKETGNGTWTSPVTSDIKWIIKKENSTDGTEESIVWLNGGQVDISNETLYSSFRYLFIRFESITHELVKKENTTTIENTVDLKNINKTNSTTYTESEILPDYTIYAVCENTLYLNNSGFIKNITSKDNSIQITNTENQSVDLKANLSEYIKNITSSDNSVQINNDTENQSIDLKVEQLTFESLTDNLTIKQDEEDASKWNFSVVTPNIPDSIDGITSNNSIKVTNGEQSTNPEISIELESSDPTLLEINRPSSDEAGKWLFVPKEPEHITSIFTITGEIEITAEEASKKCYYSEDENLKISFADNDPDTGKIMFINLYYKPASNTPAKNINENIKWVGSDDNSVIFKEGKLYFITITRSPIILSRTPIGRVNWFINVS